MLTNDPKRENNGVSSTNKNMTNLAIAATTFDIDFNTNTNTYYKCRLENVLVIISRGEAE